MYSLIRICIALRLSNNESYICVCTEMLLFMSDVLSSLTTYNYMDEHMMYSVSLLLIKLFRGILHRGQSGSFPTVTTRIYNQAYQAYASNYVLLD